MIMILFSLWSDGKENNNINNIYLREFIQPKFLACILLRQILIGNWKSLNHKKLQLASELTFLNMKYKRFFIHGSEGVGISKI